MATLAQIEFGSDTRRKGSQWGFTMSSYDQAVVDRLSNLPPEDVLYVTFATLEGDTGNHYIQGYIKTTRRFRVGKLKDLIGPAIFTIVSHVIYLLVEIQLQSAYSEFGDPRTARLSGYRNDGIKHRVLRPEDIKIRHCVCRIPDS